MAAPCRLRKALLKLREINSLVWGDYLPAGPPTSQPGGSQPAAQRATSGKAGVARNGATPAQRRLGNSALRQPLLAPHEEEEGDDVEAGPAASAAVQQGPLMAAEVDGTTGVAARPGDGAADATMLKCEKVRRVRVGSALLPRYKALCRTGPGVLLSQRVMGGALPACAAVPFPAARQPPVRMQHLPGCCCAGPHAGMAPLKAPLGPSVRAASHAGAPPASAAPRSWRSGPPHLPAGRCTARPAPGDPDGWRGGAQH